MKARVHVRLKEGVLDPQGRTVGQQLAAMGFEGITAVRVGKLIELDLASGETPEAARTRVETMCQRLLANPVIEDWSVEIVP